MLLEHLEQICKKCESLTDNKIIIFGVFCIKRQLEVLKKNFVDNKLKEILNNIDNYINNLLLTDNPERRVNFISEIEQYIENINDEELTKPEVYIEYNILNTTVDFLNSVEKNDIAYILEYSPYRNIDLINIFEEHLIGEIEDNFDNKDDKIKEIYLSEMERQMKDIDLISGKIEKNQIETMLNDKVGIDIFNDMWFSI